MRAAARFLIRSSLVLTSLVLLTGCFQDNSDLQQFIAEVKARPGGDIAPIPPFHPHEPFIYPGHRRSPFDSSVIARPLDSMPEGIPGFVDIDFFRPREPLESYPLDSLRMVGSLEQQDQLFALVRTPDRTIHSVQVGNYLGQNFGQIVAITGKAIHLREVVPDAFGGYKEQDNSVALSE